MYSIALLTKEKMNYVVIIARVYGHYLRIRDIDVYTNLGMFVPGPTLE